MNERTLERNLKQALKHAAPNDLEGVLSRCETRKESVIPMVKKKNAGRWMSKVVAACLALALVGGGAGWSHHQTSAVATVVSLDVNPSIELKVNRKEKIVEANALNEDALTVIGDMDLRGTDLNVAVNAVVGSLLRNGYLDSISSAILISVEDKDQERGIRLRQTLVGTVDDALKQASSNAAVLSQTVVQDTQLMEMAYQNNISVGKAALANKVQLNNGQTEFNMLATLSVEELNDLLKSGETRVPIGKDAAVMAAKQFARVVAMSSISWTVDAELDEYPAHYEVEISGHGEYKVDAFTGAILSGPLGKPDDVGDEVRCITQSEALLTASEHFIKCYPELNIYNIIKDTVTMKTDDGRVVYEVEFVCGGYRAEYDIDAYSAAVLDWETNYTGKVREEQSAPPDKMDPTVSDNNSIGTEKAKALALAHAGVAEGQVTGLQVEQDYDDGRLEYEVDFRCGGFEYEYTIDGVTGAVLEHQNERDD